MGNFVLEHVRDFQPRHIFDCGQAFRWEREEDGSYTGIAGGRIANIRFEPDSEDPGQGRVIFSNVEEREFTDFWKDYLDLKRDYGAIKRALAQKDPVIRTAIQAGDGIRLLRQDPWETLISFLISQNNHIPRIKNCIRTLCEQFGQPAGVYGGRVFYSFPRPEDLAGLEPEDLAPCRMGYRTKYITAAARKVAEDGGRRLRAMCGPEIAAEEAFRYVTGFSGVGPKVANCVLLFSMGKYDSFPVDVWVKKVMKELYGLDSAQKIMDFAGENYGGYGGFAQQYLFYYIREREREGV